MPGPIDPNEYAFQIEQTTRRIEIGQRRARNAFAQTREHTEALIRQDLKAWARENVDKAGRLRAGVSLVGADRIIQGHMDRFLRDVTGSSQWPPTKADFARGPHDLKGLATHSIEEIDKFREEMGLDGPDADEFVRSAQARSIWEDHRLNPVGVRERETRQLREDLRRIKASRMPTDQIDGTLESWHMDEGTFRLATDSHALAYGRSYLGRLGRDMKADRFVAHVSESTARALAPGGRTSQVAFRTFTRPELDDVYRKVNAGRRGTTSFDTMGLGHGTKELYFPLPPQIADELVDLYKATRTRFRGQKAGTLEPETAFSRENARQAVKDVRADLMLEKIPQGEIDAILERLEQFAGLKERKVVAKVVETAGEKTARVIAETKARQAAIRKRVEEAAAREATAQANAKIVADHLEASRLERVKALREGIKGKRAKTAPKWHGNPGPMFRDAVKDALAAIPGHLRRVLTLEGGQVHAGKTLTKTAGMRPDLSGVHPRGWAKEATWDEVDGLASGRLAYVAEEAHYRDGARRLYEWERHQQVTIHEFGHTLDKVAGSPVSGRIIPRSELEDFGVAWADDVGRMTAAEKDRWAYFTKNDNERGARSEAWAEVFFATITKDSGKVLGQGSRVDDLLRAFPEVAKIIRQTIRELRP